MAVIFGLLTAFFFGAGDFCGGLSAKRVSVLAVVAFSHLVGLIGVAILTPFLAEQFVWADLFIGMVAGASGGVGVALLYRGLARGPMVVVAPLTAITSAAVPSLWGVITGETFSGRAWVGIVIALAAIVMISIPNSANNDGAANAPITSSVVIESLISGSMFGLMFILFDATSEVSAPWPVVGARILTSGLLVGVMVTQRRSELGSLRPALPTIILTGLFDTGSNTLFLFATNVGDLAIVAVLSSLYPVTTVLLARVVLNERMSRLQLGGLLAALTATALIAAG